MFFLTRRSGYRKSVDALLALLSINIDRDIERETRGGARGVGVEIRGSKIGTEGDSIVHQIPNRRLRRLSIGVRASSDPLSVAFRHKRMSSISRNRLNNTAHGQCATGVFRVLLTTPVSSIETHFDPHRTKKKVFLFFQVVLFTSSFRT